MHAGFRHAGEHQEGAEGVQRLLHARDGEFADQTMTGRYDVPGTDPCFVGAECMLRHLQRLIGAVTGRRAGDFRDESFGAEDAHLWDAVQLLLAAQRQHSPRRNAPAQIAASPHIQMLLDLDSPSEIPLLAITSQWRPYYMKLKLKLERPGGVSEVMALGSPPLSVNDL